MSMRLKVLLPTEVIVDEPVTKVVAEARNGSFGILPLHIDFVAALSPGVLSFIDAAGNERFVGLDEGVLVKCAGDLTVSTRNAARGDDLQAMRAIVRERFVELDERERSARSALARLEAGVVRRFSELQGRL